MPVIKQLVIDTHPLMIAIGGISLEHLHEGLSVFALIAGAVYTCGKIYQDFIKPKK